MDYLALSTVVLYSHCCRPLLVLRFHLLIIITPAGDKQQHFHTVPQWIGGFTTPSDMRLG